MQNNQETLLRVEHLCQYFKMEGGELKAVDDVSFEIHEGEVFGLVGESGCGKTTTGRSIIKLYNITSGNIFFKGIRIAAGKRSYRDAIRAAREAYKARIAELDAQVKAGTLPKADRDAAAQTAKTEMDATIAENRRQIKLADEDQTKCDKKYAAEQIEKITA